MYIYICMYVAIDLKVLIRSFNCESRACYVGNPRVFFEFAKGFFFNIYIFMGIHNINMYTRTYNP